MFNRTTRSGKKNDPFSENIIIFNNAFWFVNFTISPGVINRLSILSYLAQHLLPHRRIINQ